MALEFINKTFNNREIALIFYLFIFFLWTMRQKKIRKRFFDLINTLFAKQIILSILCLLIYVTIIIYGLSLIDLWNIRLIKDSIYWTFGVGFILMMNSNKALHEENYFKDFVRENVKLFMILEFILGLYTFGLITELILMPIVIFFSLLLGYTEVNEEYKKTKDFLNKILGIIGILYVMYSVYKISQNFVIFSNYDNFRAFIFPAIMTIMFLPFAYFYVLYTHYESLFIRIDIFLKDHKSLRRFAKWKILLSVKFSWQKLKLITPGYPLGGCRTKEDIKHEIDERLKITKNNT